MSPGKLLTFCLATLVGGLLQVWALWLILVVGLDKSVGAAELLSDGGLFFFTTSVAVSSFLLLIDQHDLKAGTADLNITLVVAVFVGLPAVVVYTAVMSANFGTSNPFKNYLLPQLVCAAAAFSYAFYVAVRTGQLKP